MSNLVATKEINTKDNLKDFVQATLAACVTPKSNIAYNLKLLDSAWEAQKLLWAEQELLPSD